MTDPQAPPARRRSPRRRLPVGDSGRFESGKNLVPASLRRAWLALAEMTGGRPLGWGPTAYLAAVAALAVALVLARMSTWGVGWDGDSVRYLAAARTLLAGAGLQDIYDAPFTYWPPLYPLLLAAGGLLVDPLEVPGPLNLVAFALTIFCFGRYLWARLDSFFLRLWTPLAAALSLPLAESARWAMTETLFILLTTLALVSVEEYRANGAWKALVSTAVLSAMAWQTRYMGVALLVTVGLLVLTAARRPFRERVKRLAVFGAIAAAPMALWALRNYGLVGRPIPSLFPQDYSWRGLFDDLIGRLSSWTDFDWSPSSAVIVLSLTLVAILARRRPGTVGRGTSRREAFSNPNPITGWALFGLSYLACLTIALWLGGTWNGVQARLVTPLYIPALAVLAIVTDRFLVHIRSRHWVVRLPGPALMIVLSTWLLGQAGPAARAITAANSDDFAIYNGWASARWTQSETLRALSSLGVRPTWTNNLSVVSLHTGARGLTYLPLSRELATDSYLAEWLDRLPDRLLMVWFRQWDRDLEQFVPTPLALGAVPSITMVGEFADGAIFEVDRTSSPSKSSPLADRFDPVVADLPDEPLVSDVFEVYAGENGLRYFKEPCFPGDVEERFRLTLTVPSVTGSRWPAVEDLYFDFTDYGVLWKGRCLAIVPLPGDRYSRFETGQPGGTTPWRASGRLDPDRYRTAFRSIASGEWGAPFARSDFDLYLDGTELRYYREPCAPSDTEARFFVELHAARDGSRPGEMEYRDFDFEEHGIVEDGKCLALVPLPAAGYERFETGQWGETTSWRAAGRLDEDRYRAALRARASGAWGAPLTSSTFDLYYDEAELRYYRAPCAAEDVEERFFLRLREATGEGRRAENRNFHFPRYGHLLDGECLAMVPLPSGHEFGRIVTGQFTSGAPPTWRAELWPVTRRIESITSGGLGPPAARSVFDLYFDDSEALFYRASCAAGDVEAKFFLHFYPEEETTLPTERREHGFLNLDFDFADSGLLHEGECLASAPLPESGGGRLRVGQFLPGGERLWSAEADLPPSR